MKQGAVPLLLGLGRSDDQAALDGLVLVKLADENRDEQLGGDCGGDDGLRARGLR